MKRDKSPKTRTKFHFGHEVIDTETKIGCRITKSAHPVPKYTWQTGHYNGQGDWVPFIPASVTPENIFSGEMVWDPTEIALDCLDDARDWMEGDLKSECDAAAQRASKRQETVKTTENSTSEKEDAEVSV